MSAASVSLISNAQLLGKVYFPRLLVPLAPLGAGLVDHVIALGLLFAVMAVYGIFPPLWGLLVLPLLVVLVVMAAAGFSIWLAALGALYRDIRYVTPFLLQMLLFVTPIIHVLDSVPESVRPFYSINPLVGVVSGFRSALLGQGDLPVDSLLTSAFVSTTLIVSGLLYFRNVERALADVA